MSIASCRPVSSILAIVTASALTSACAGSPEADESPTASSSTSARATGATLSVRTVEEVGATRLTLPDDPDWLALDVHGLWVQGASGELTLVDPDTAEVTGSVALGVTDLCQGLGASYGAEGSGPPWDQLAADPGAQCERSVWTGQPSDQAASQSSAVAGRSR